MCKIINEQAEQIKALQLCVDGLEKHARTSKAGNGSESSASSTSEDEDEDQGSTPIG